MRCATLLIYLISAVVFALPCADAANIYVDPFPESHSDETWSGVNGESYSSTDPNFPGVGTGYSTVQAAITAMAGGDDIYLRGGTYSPTHLTGSSESGEVKIPQSKNGSDGNWSSIQSYPGEWAILDGDNKCGDRGGVIGLRDWDKDGTTDLKYWRFERLEIKNGASTDGTKASGIWVNGGPFIVRFCYIHNNLVTSGGENPAGITGMVWKDSVVEYCYLKDNGVTGGNYNDHSAQIQIHTDYRYQAEYWESAPYDINHALQNNIVRYCLFDNAGQYAQSGIHNKARQYLTPKTDVSWTYKEYGDKYHHNIFLGFPRAIGSQQDFQQIFNNIMVSSALNFNDGAIAVTDPGAEGNNVAATVYNNTIISGRVANNFGYGTYVINPYFYMYNNLIDDGPSDYDGAGLVNLGYAYMATSFVYEPARTDLTNNYMYRCNSTNIDVTRNTGECYGLLPQSAYDACYSETNYSKATSEGTDNIFVGATGADQYITRGAHVVSGSTTIADGGRGESHPYLTGVTIPSYIGATNPSDNTWVGQVYALDVAYFTAETGQGDTAYDASWIEGETPTISAPSGFRATGGMGWR